MGFTPMSYDPAEASAQDEITKDKKRRRRGYCTGFDQGDQK